MQLRSDIRGNILVSLKKILCLDIHQAGECLFLGIVINLFPI